VLVLVFCFQTIFQRYTRKDFMKLCYCKAHNT